MKRSCRTLGHVLCATLLLLVSTHSAAAHTSRRELLQQVHQRPDDLDRYLYLLATLPQVAPADRNLALQLLSFSENELGLYTEALRDFPLRMALPPRLQLPSPAQWQAVNAVDAITAAAADRQIVMINEAHHDAQTRLLTLALLPRLRAEGFGYFAVEALDRRDTALSQRGYPLLRSGTQYLHEPIYGEVIREALRLGYTLVAYEADADSGGGQTRETEQARHLYQQVFARDPDARLLVHAGYAHIDKKPGRLGNLQPMAMMLQQLTGITPLSIDQTDLREDDPQRDALAIDRALAEDAKIAGLLKQGSSGAELLDAQASRRRRRRIATAYGRLIEAYQPSSAVAFRRADDTRWWSARPGTYDISVVLPPSTTAASNYDQGPLWLVIDGKRIAVMPPATNGARPVWLSLGGSRRATPVNGKGCRGALPCLVEAYFVDEPDSAVAADRYVFLQAGQSSALYLRPGIYRIRYVDAAAKVVDQKRIEVANQP